MPKLLLSTWNINSIRLRLPLLMDFLGHHQPDILAVQETKVIDDLFPSDAIKSAGYPHICFTGMPGYNGVAILSKIPLDLIRLPDWCGKKDCRSIAARLPNGAEIYNFYVPAGGDIPDPKQNEKFAHKLQFIGEMEKFWAKTVDKKTPRVLMGDLNIAPLEHDVWSHKQLLDVVSHTPIEVSGLNATAAAGGWIDVARHFIPATEKSYSWWSYRAQDWRASDRGRRLDHIWVSPPLHDGLLSYASLKDARDWQKPSDHVPILAAMKM